MKTPPPANAKLKKSNEAKINDLEKERSQFDVSQFATCFEEFTNHMKERNDPNLALVQNALLRFLNDKIDTSYDKYSKAIDGHTPVKKLLDESSTQTWDQNKLSVALSMFGSQNGNKLMVMKNKTYQTTFFDC